MSELEILLKNREILFSSNWKTGSPFSPLGDALILVSRHSLKGTQFYAQVTAPAYDALIISEPKEAIYLPELLSDARAKETDIIEIDMFRHNSDEFCLDYARGLAMAYCTLYGDLLPSRFTPEEMAPK